MVSCELLGVPYGDREEIRAWSTRVISTAGFSVEEITEAIGQIREYLAAARRADPGHDLITELVGRTDDEDALSETELLANLQLLLIAGHETTANQLSNSLLTLFRHPDQLALLRDDPVLIERSIDELMRYVRLAAPLVAVIALRDIEVAGVAITAGDAVVVVSAAANRDASVFADPDRLDLTRPNSSQTARFRPRLPLSRRPTRPAGTSHRTHHVVGSVSQPDTRGRRNTRDTRQGAVHSAYVDRVFCATWPSR